jgi:hypothetical protein
MQEYISKHDELAHFPDLGVVVLIQGEQDEQAGPDCVPDGADRAILSHNGVRAVARVDHRRHSISDACVVS